MNTQSKPDEERVKLERGVAAQKSDPPRQGEPVNKPDEGGRRGRHSRGESGKRAGALADGIRLRERDTRVDMNVFWMGLGRRERGFLTATTRERHA